MATEVWLAGAARRTMQWHAWHGPPPSSTENPIPKGDDGWSTVPPTTSTSTASLVESGSKPVDAVRLSNKYGSLETGISGKASGGSKSHPHARLGKPISPRPTGSTPAGCTSIFVLLLSFLAALARMFFLPGVAELLCWCGSAFAVGVQRNGKKSSWPVKANKAPAGLRGPSRGRAHVVYLLAALHLYVSGVAGYKTTDRQPARSNLFSTLPPDESFIDPAPEHSACPGFSMTAGELHSFYHFPEQWLYFPADQSICAVPIHIATAVGRECIRNETALSLARTVWETGLGPGQGTPIPSALPCACSSDRLKYFGHRLDESRHPFECDSNDQKNGCWHDTKCSAHDMCNLGPSTLIFGPDAWPLPLPSLGPDAEKSYCFGSTRGIGCGPTFPPILKQAGAAQAWFCVPPFLDEPPTPPRPPPLPPPPPPPCPTGTFSCDALYPGTNPPSNDPCWWPEESPLGLKANGSQIVNQALRAVLQQCAAPPLLFLTDASDASNYTCSNPQERSYDKHDLDRVPRMGHIGLTFLDTLSPSDWADACSASDGDASFEHWSAVVGGGDANLVGGKVANISGDFAFLTYFPILYQAHTALVGQEHSARLTTALEECTGLLTAVRDEIQHNPASTTGQAWKVIPSTIESLQSLISSVDQPTYNASLGTVPPGSADYYHTAIPAYHTAIGKLVDALNADQRAAERDKKEGAVDNYIEKLLMAVNDNVESGAKSSAAAAMESLQKQIISQAECVSLATDRVSAASGRMDDMRTKANDQLKQMKDATNVFLGLEIANQVADLAGMAMDFMGGEGNGAAQEVKDDAKEALTILTLSKFERALLNAKKAAISTFKSLVVCPPFGNARVNKACHALGMVVSHVVGGLIKKAKTYLMKGGNKLGWTAYSAGRRLKGALDALDALKADTKVLPSSDSLPNLTTSEQLAQTRETRTALTKLGPSYWQAYVADASALVNSFVSGDNAGGSAAGFAMGYTQYSTAYASAGQEYVAAADSMLACFESMNQATEQLITLNSTTTHAANASVTDEPSGPAKPPTIYKAMLLASQINGLAWHAHRLVDSICAALAFQVTTLYKHCVAMPGAIQQMCGDRNFAPALLATDGSVTDAVQSLSQFNARMDTYSAVQPLVLRNLWYASTKGLSSLSFNLTVWESPPCPSFQTIEDVVACNSSLVVNASCGCKPSSDNCWNGTKPDDITCCAINYTVCEDPNWPYSPPKTPHLSADAFARFTNRSSPDYGRISFSVLPEASDPALYTVLELEESGWNEMMGVNEAFVQGYAVFIPGARTPGGFSLKTTLRPTGHMIQRVYNYSRACGGSRLCPFDNYSFTGAINVANMTFSYMPQPAATCSTFCNEVLSSKKCFGVTSTGHFLPVEKATDPKYLGCAKASLVAKPWGTPARLLTGQSLSDPFNSGSVFAEWQLEVENKRLLKDDVDLTDATHIVIEMFYTAHTDENQDQDCSLAKSDTGATDAAEPGRLLNLTV